jgi:hypothetical protein
MPQLAQAPRQLTKPWNAKSRKDTHRFLSAECRVAGEVLGVGKNEKY